MPNTEKLLSIQNFKKYFPIAKSSIFQRQQFYVRANEDISLDIFKGETLGLVGESGCGKSTLGRTLLQLYDQTAGTTMYYGRTLDDFAPSYVEYTLTHTVKMITELNKKLKKAADLTAECEEAGENATFFQIQNKNLAVADAETSRQKIVKILGGFITLEDPTEGAKLLLNKHRIALKTAKIRHGLADTLAAIDLHKSLLESLDDNKLSILNFAYTASKNYSHYEHILDKLLEIRICPYVMVSLEEIDLHTLIQQILKSRKNFYITLRNNITILVPEIPYISEKIKRSRVLCGDSTKKRHETGFTSSRIGHLKTQMNV